MLSFLPDKIKIGALKCGIENICEIRIRRDKPVIAYLKTKTNTKKRVVVCASVSCDDIEKMVLKLSNFSIFSAEESLKRGFITSSEGERVGICGECVYESGKIVAVKNFTSLCVRFDHQVKDCALDFYQRYVDEEPKSCLVISPPYQGKTTFIRDLGRLYSEKLNVDVLFIDERDELSSGQKFDLGVNSDVLRYADKKFGFYVGVRTINPSVIVCDELMDDFDADALMFAVASGVKVVASVHAKNFSDLRQKDYLNKLIENKVFDIITEMKDQMVRGVYVKDNSGRYNYDNMYADG